MKNKIYEASTLSPNGKNFTITSYFRTEPSDKQFINNNAEEIQAFMEAGYKYAGLGKFKGCDDYKSLKNNFIVIKIARDSEGVPIAMSVYTKRFGGKSKDINEIGKKCAGMTATTDESRRLIGKEACKYIIREDMSMYDKFYWLECDGVIEHWCETSGGIKIPNCYIDLYLDMNKIIDYEPVDDYHYTRKLGDKTVTKVIYGFNHRETLDNLIKSDDSRIINAIKQAKQKMLSESLELIKSNDEVGFAEYIIFMFYGMCEDGITEFTSYQRYILKKQIKIIETFLMNNELSDEDEDDYASALWNAKHMLNSTTLLKIYEFGNLLEVPDDKDFYRDVDGQII